MLILYSWHRYISVSIFNRSVPLYDLSESHWVRKSHEIHSSLALKSSTREIVLEKKFSFPKSKESDDKIQNLVTVIQIYHCWLPQNRKIHYPLSASRLCPALALRLSYSWWSLHYWTSSHGQKGYLQLFQCSSRNVTLSLIERSAHYHW